MELYIVSMLLSKPGHVVHAPGMLLAEGEDAAVGRAMRMARTHFADLMPGNIDVAVTRITSEKMAEFVDGLRPVPEAQA